MALRDYDAVRTRAFRGPDNRPKIMRVVQTVRKDDERRLASLSGKRKNVIQGDLNVPTAVRYFLMNSLRHR